MADPVEVEDVGQLVGALGVTMRKLAPGELVAGAVVLLRVVDDEGNTYMRTTWSTGMTWLDRLGLVHAAHEVELKQSVYHAGDDD